MKKLFKFIGIGFTGILAIIIAVLIGTSVPGSTHSSSSTTADSSSIVVPTSTVKSKKRATETPEATATPKAKKSRKQIKAEYTPLDDVRELVARTGKMRGEKIVVSGEVMSSSIPVKKQNSAIRNPRYTAPKFRSAFLPPTGQWKVW